MFFLMILNITHSWPSQITKSAEYPKFSASHVFETHKFFEEIELGVEMNLRATEVG